MAHLGLERSQLQLYQVGHDLGHFAEIIPQYGPRRGEIGAPVLVLKFDVTRDGPGDVCADRKRDGRVPQCSLWQFCVADN